MKARPVTNPLNRFREVAVAYDDGEGPPPAKVTLLDDQSRSILSANDSPDVPFRWSVNPYRGCLHACAYCLDGATPILMGDSRTRALADLRVGDEIYGTQLVGRLRRLVRTRVVDHWATRKPAYRITLADGTTLVASGDHRFLTDRGWKHVTPDPSGGQRPALTHNNSLLGVGQFAEPPAETDEYRRGYLCGMVRGDATLRSYDYSGRRRATDVLHQFRLALVDLEALARTKRYLASFAVETQEFEFVAARAGHAAMQAIRSSMRSSVEAIRDLIAFPDIPSDAWSKGFVAGIFDAEGSLSQHVLRISNKDETMIDMAVQALQRLRFDAVIEKLERENGPIYNVRVRGGRPEHLRLFHTTAPAITRKWNLQGASLKHGVDLRVASIEPVGTMPLFDITTGTGDFIANGVVSHNCYARPSHEYLDLGAGTDFDTKIVVKREAPALLREAFEKPSWRGELVMFSGVTDCYQAIEGELGLTRGCLEVCLAYRNPVNVISKSALVERDIDLFVALAREASFSIFVSLAFADNAMSRALEPWAPSPDRRFKVIERLAAAGLDVGVMVAPIIPGVNDRQVVPVLERAAAAGARRAGWVLLRLPGAVKQVFEERVRAALPLAADRILNRIRDTRGGDKLYDSTFGVRGRGEGAYADAIATMFDATVRRLGLAYRSREALRAEEPPSTFRRPPRQGPQLSLFE